MESAGSDESVWKLAEYCEEHAWLVENLNSGQARVLALSFLTYVEQQQLIHLASEPRRHNETLLANLQSQGARGFQCLLNILDFTKVTAKAEKLRAALVRHSEARCPMSRQLQQQHSNPPATEPVSSEGQSGDDTPQQQQQQQQHQAGKVRFLQEFDGLSAAEQEELITELQQRRKKKTSGTDGRGCTASAAGE